MAHALEINRIAAHRADLEVRHTSHMANRRTVGQNDLETLVGIKFTFFHVNREAFVLVAVTCYLFYGEYCAHF